VNQVRAIEAFLVHVRNPLEAQTGRSTLPVVEFRFWNDGDGVRNNATGAGRAFNTNWGLNIGTKNTANTNGIMLIRITVGPSFSGSFTGITFNYS